MTTWGDPEQFPGDRSATDAILDLWDQLIGLAERIGAEALSRPTPCAGTDVGALVAHIAGVHGPISGADGLVAGLRRARAAQIAGWRADGTNPVLRRRQLGASCLDLWVHAWDLATAVGEPVDLDEDSAALAEAWNYLSAYLPRLAARWSGAAEDAALRIVLNGPVDHAAGAAVQGGRAVWSPDRDRGQHTVTGKMGALVLLVSGRGDPEHWRERNALAWSGSSGEAFVHRARLFS